jgi:hypothetical protein
MARVVLKPGEFGRGRDLSANRLEEVDNACEEFRMTRHQALSLRRSLMRQRDGNRRVNQSAQMGSAQGQQHVADLFEMALVDFLKSIETCAFKTEAEIRQAAHRVPTPDVLFTTPVEINGQAVNWLDCKMYYGCALLAGNSRLPVGKLRETEEKFVRHYGPGGFVFGQGFCADLQRHVPNAILLDASPLDMQAVMEFQDKQ